MKNKKFISVIAIIALLTFIVISLAPTVSTIVSATETRAQLEEKLKKSQDAKDAAKKKADSLTSQKKEIATELEKLNKEVAEVENEVNEMASAIYQNEVKINEQQEKITQYDGNFKERARVMYKYGSISYLDVLFGTNDFGDLLSNMQIAEKIISYDRDVLQQMAYAKEELEEQRTQLEYNKKILENKQNEFESKIAVRNQKMSQIDSDVATAKAQADKEDAEMQKIRDQIAAMTKNEGAYTPPASSSSSDSSSSDSSSNSSSNNSSSSSNNDSGGMVWPSEASRTITSPYGWRIHPIQKYRKLHTGIDIGASSGTGVLAAAAGKVIMSSWNGGYGKCVVISHGNGLSTLYGHNSSLLVSVGQHVSKGQRIALVGSTGNSTGPHIHFEVLKNGQHTDPLAYVSR